MSWMIYGANGYTGQLIVDECLKHGLRPILAGRNAQALQALAARTGWEARAFALDDAAKVVEQTKGMHLVLHCAGPFSKTSKPMLDACLANSAHYLDITGEIDVFAACHARDAEAKAAGIAVVPGVGFDVVPTDCLAMLLSHALSDARELVLAFDAEGGPSVGTALSSVEGAAKGGCVRRDGKLVRVPLAWQTRNIHFAHGQRRAATIPWGDVYTAFVSTGIANIEVYMALPPSHIRTQKLLNWVRPLLGLSPIQALLKRKIRSSVAGPSEQRRKKSRSYLYGHVRNSSGKSVRAQMTTPNGYLLTAESSVAIARHILANPPRLGYSTPGQLMGPDFVKTLTGVQLSMDCA